MKNKRTKEMHVCMRQTLIMKAKLTSRAGSHPSKRKSKIFLLQKRLGPQGYSFLEIYSYQIVFVVRVIGRCSIDFFCHTFDIFHGGMYKLFMLIIIRFSQNKARRHAYWKKPTALIIIFFLLYGVIKFLSSGTGS